MNLSPIISAKELKQISNQENLIIVDAGSGGKTYEEYLESHLANALYVDLNKDLAEVPENAQNGGRHPLPSLEKFAEVLKNLGVDRASHVVVYDRKNSTNAAPRFWWMLRSAGIKNVQVLDGGYPLPKSDDGEEELPTESGISQPKSLFRKEKLTLHEWQLPLVNINYIKDFSQNPDYLVIDVREKDRYNGIFEPIDQISGHILGAVNLPFVDNYHSDGTLLSPELHEKYSNILKNLNSENISIHCGSGVTACNTILALNYAGFNIPNLYVGSWSEWSNNVGKGRDLPA